MQNEVSLLNTLLLYFHKNQHSSDLMVQNLPIAFSGVAPNINIERLCEQLYSDGLFYKEKSGPNSIYLKTKYSISTKGILLFENIPPNYNEQPYTYYLIKQNEKKKRKEDKEKLELKSIETNIGVADSVKKMNKKSIELAGDTQTFYTKQNGFNKWQKWLTIAIAVSTVAYSVITFLMLKAQDKYSQSENQQLYQLEQSLKDHTKRDSIFEQRVKDSLKIP